MSDDENTEFASADAGASTTYPSQASALRKGQCLVIKDRPCKIVDMSTSKTGKHGHAKIHFTALDIFSGKKFEDIVPSTHNVSVPHCTRTEFVLIDIDDGFMNLMNESGDIREDIKVPLDNLGDEILEKHGKASATGCEVVVTVLKSMNEETAVSVKMSNAKDNK